jgi:hypothetical protein
MKKKLYEYTVLQTGIDYLNKRAIQYQQEGWEQCGDVFIKDNKSNMDVCKVPMRRLLKN